MEEQNNTEKQISRLVGFRQAIYEHGFLHRRDAQYELLDALLLKDQIASFPMLSCSAAFRRRWQSAYAALERGQQDQGWLRSYLAKQVPEGGIRFFSLDITAWARPQAHSLPDRLAAHRRGRGCFDAGLHNSLRRLVWPVAVCGITGSRSPHSKLVCQGKRKERAA